MSLKRSSSLREELPKWVQEGLITSDTADVLSDRYELSSEDPWYKKTSFYVSLVATILVSMGVILVISENWDHLPIPARMSVGLLPWFAAMFGTWKVHSDGRKTVAEAWGFLTGLLLGANIFLQAQIFHISGYEPDAVLWWLIGVLPLALVLRSQAVLFLAQALTVIWLGMETAFDNFNVLVIPVTAAVIVSGRGLVGKTTTLGVVITLCLMVNHVEQGFIDPERTQYLALLTAYAVFALGMLLSARGLSESFRITVSFLTTAFVVFCALVGTTLSWENPEILGVQDWFAVLLAIIGTGVVVWRSRAPLAVGSAAIGLLMSCSTYIPASQTGETILSIALNVALFFGSIWLIHSGVQRTSKLVFMSGLLVIIALALTRFGDYFDNYIVGAIVFIVAGIGLVLANMYWNKKYAS